MKRWPAAARGGGAEEDMVGGLTRDWGRGVREIFVELGGWEIRLFMIVVLNEMGWSVYSD